MCITARANEPTLPTVIESVGDQGQWVEQGFVWQNDSATDCLLHAFNVLLSAEQVLETSRRRVAIEAGIIRQLLKMK
jgi:hypothetical protein